MTRIICGERVRGFIVFTDDSGLRYAIRQNAVLALSDGDEDRGTTVIQMPGGRSVHIAVSLDEALAWFT